MIIKVPWNGLLYVPLISSQKQRFYVTTWKLFLFFLGSCNHPRATWLATYRKTKGIQSYLRLWGTYDPIESGPSEQKNGCSVKKCGISDQKCIFLAPNPFLEMVQFCCYYHYWTPNRQHFCVDPVARRASGRLLGPIFARNSAFFGAKTIKPHFLAQTDTTQWDHTAPIPWGNSG